MSKDFWNYPSSSAQAKSEFHEMYLALTDPDHEGSMEKRIAAQRAERARENEEDAGLI